MNFKIKKISIWFNKKSTYKVVNIFSQKSYQIYKTEKEKKIVPIEYSLETFHRSNQDTCLVHKPVVFEGDWVETGDLLADCSASVGGELSLGHNILIAYMPWEGFNYEDAILISERLVYDDVYTSVHIERYETEIRETKNGKEKITKEIPDVFEKEIKHLNNIGVCKIGTLIEEGAILVGKITPINQKNHTPYQKLLYTLLEKKFIPYKDNSLRAPKGIKAKVINVYFFKKPTKNAKKELEKQNLDFARYTNLAKTFYPNNVKISKQIPSEMQKQIKLQQSNFINLKNTNIEKNIFLKNLIKKSNNILAPREKKLNEFLTNLVRDFVLINAYDILKLASEKTRFYLKTKSCYTLKDNRLQRKMNFLLNFINIKRVSDESRQRLRLKEKNTKNIQPSFFTFSLNFINEMEKKKQKSFEDNMSASKIKTEKLSLLFSSQTEKPRKASELSNVKNVKKTNDEFYNNCFIVQDFLVTKTFQSLINNIKKVSRSVYVSSAMQHCSAAKAVRLAPLAELAQKKSKTITDEKTNRTEKSLGLFLLNQKFQNIKSSWPWFDYASVRKLKKDPKFFQKLDEVSSKFSYLQKNKIQNLSLYNLKNEKQKNFNIKTQSNDFISETISQIHIYLAEKRKIQVGDKMSGRHGNKGIVSQILPRQDMPYLPDGTPVDMVLNPLGVPSRMNVGQIFECLLGLAGKYLGTNYRILPFDEIYGPEASRSFVFSKLYEARKKTGMNWLFDPNFPGKTRLFDGRTGDCFDQPVTVGLSYILKLVHLVDDKMHSRSTGPYSLVTQQPLRGRSKQGGQRLGEMEVWALEGYGAAFILLEMLTIKSDNISGRLTLWSNLLLNRKISLGTPESFKVLVSELQSLCLSIELF